MIDPELMPYLVAGLGAMAFGAFVFVIIYPMFSGDRARDKRMSAMTENRAKKVATRTANDVASNRRKAVADTLKDIESKKKSQEKLTVRLMLERAGVEIPVKTFWLLSAALGVACAIVVFFSAPSGNMGLMAAGAAAFVGFLGLPRWILKRMVSKRQIKFQRELANAIDVVVRGIKTGLPLNECLAIIARESPDPINKEFQEVVDQQRVGVTLGESLERMVQRVPLSEVKFLSIVIGIQTQAGGNLSESLENLSTVLRDRFKLQQKVRALSAEAKASASVLASLPPVVACLMTFVNPSYLEPMFVTTTGNFLLLGCLVWMGMGVLVMKKMINFKF
jgi:tight adherence protein B